MGRLNVDATNVVAWDMEGIRSIFIVKFVVDFRQRYLNIEKKKMIIPQI